MSDDIVTRTCCVERSCGNYDARAVIDHLHGEIERLRVALALACNELFGTCDPLQTSPKQLMAHFLEEARRG